MLVQKKGFKSAQQGVGMIEVLVAMLLLAIGVIGFAALQVRALGASNEGMVRTQAMQIARDLAERIRVNHTLGYAQYVNSLKTPDTGSFDCVTQYCSPVNMAKYDVQAIRANAQNIGATIAYPVCYGMNDKLNGRRCIYVAWGATKASDGAASGGAECTFNGKYNIANTSTNKPTTCVMMEMY